MMRLLLVLAFVLSTIVVAAIDNKVLPLKLSRSTIDTLALSSTEKQFSSNSVPLLNNYNFYTINVTFGSDKQEISLNVGTGTGDTWVPAKGSDACLSANCSLYGSFNSTTSTTWLNSSQPFDITFGDGSKISGYYGGDDFSIPNTDASLPLKFGVVTEDMAVPIGVLGLGYEVSEATTNQGKNNSDTYANFLSVLVEQGIINSKTFSLYLNDVRSTMGEILFGGFDPEKFTSPLVSMPVVSSIQGVYSQPQIPLTEISFTSDNQNVTYTSSNFAQAAVLDSATTDILLPSDLVQVIMQSWNATSYQGDYFLPCNAVMDPTAKLTFGFNGNGGAAIDVYLSTLLKLEDPQINIQGQVLCKIPINNDGTTPGANAIVLGTFFLRSAYVVFDLTNNMIAVAQAKLNATDSSIQELQNTTSIPGAMVMNTIVASLNVSATATNILQTTASIPHFMFTQTPTVTTSSGPPATSSPSPTPSSNTLSGGAIAGIVIGCLVGAAILAFLIGKWVYRRYRDRRYEREALRAEEQGTEMN